MTRRQLIWERLTKRPDGSPIGLPSHLFFFITFIFGLAFALPASFSGAGVTELYQFAAQAHILVPYIWGYWLVAASILNVVVLLTRTKYLSSFPSMMGFTGWLFATIAYAATGFWLGLIVSSVPQMIFWAWYFFRVKMWHRYLFD